MSLRDMVINVGIGLVMAAGLVSLLSYYIKADPAQAVAAIWIQLLGVEIALLGWLWPSRAPHVSTAFQATNATLGSILRQEREP